MNGISDWVRCPRCGSVDTRVVIVEPGQVGIRCINCNAKTETPVEVVDPQYRTISRAP
jgi:translation initiation factor 2 beta subunit (eIF-2beta)/eIF-5